MTFRQKEQHSIILSNSGLFSIKSKMNRIDRLGHNDNQNHVRRLSFCMSVCLYICTSSGSSRSTER